MSVSNKLSANLVENTKTASESGIATPRGSIIAGQYNTTKPTPVSGDYVFLQLGSSGGLVTESQSYDSDTTSDKVFEINPLSVQSVAISLLDDTNIAVATNYYPNATGASMDGYTSISFTGKFIDADGVMTMTVEAMDDEDTTSGDWIDVTNSFIDEKASVATSIGASVTVTNGTVTFAIANKDFNYENYRVKMVNNGATNTGIIKERKKAI